MKGSLSHGWSLTPCSQVNEFEMGGVQESSLHVYLDGPATTKPLGHVSSMDSPI